MSGKRRNHSPATGRNIIGLCVENSHFAYLLNKKRVAHAPCLVANRGCANGMKNR
ncbi:hypothetical protein SAMN05421690_103822 [Nitrosomonas sp. Nm51]|nr:hypothetical protein SAMN05421690_103822 [Nitrosomonas sp. Nm51]